MLFLVILLIIFLTFLVGVALTVGSIVFGLKRRNFLQKAAVTVGTVMRFSAFRNSYYSAAARFQTADGQVIDCETRFKSIKRYSVGEPITVSYDPQNPHSVILGERNLIAPWIQYFVSGGIGSVITLISGILLVFILMSKPAPSSLPPYITPDKADGNTQNATNGGELRQCPERQNLQFIRATDAESVQLTVNNKSQNSVSVYLIGANNYQSKYETIAPNKSQTFRSPKRGEWWMITDSATGACKAIVSPPNLVNIE